MQRTRCRAEALSRSYWSQTFAVSSARLAVGSRHMAGRVHPSSASPGNPRGRVSKAVRGGQSPVKRRTSSENAAKSSRIQPDRRGQSSPNSSGDNARKARNPKRPSRATSSNPRDRTNRAGEGSIRRSSRRSEDGYGPERGLRNPEERGARHSDRRSGFVSSRNRMPGSRESRPDRARNHGGSTSIRGTNPRRASTQRRDSDRFARGNLGGGRSSVEPGRPDWGSVARRGAFRVTAEPEEQPRPRRSDSRSERGRDERPRHPNARFRVVRSNDGVRVTRNEQLGSAPPAARRGRGPRGRRTPAGVRTDVASAAPARLRAQIERRLAEAAAAYERDRYQDALRILRSLPHESSNIGAVRELRGLTFYRLGRWSEALRELRAFVVLTGSIDQHPVIADSERALGHHDRVAAIWSEIRQSGTSSDVLAEGRLVMAGSLADRGMYKEAIALLGPATLRKVAKPHERHIRQWYLLGDLYERTGDVPRARGLFKRVVDADPETSDAVERLSSLSAPSRRSAPKRRR